MKHKYIQRTIGFIFAALMLLATVFVSSETVEAQHRRRVTIVRPSYRYYHPFGFRRWDPWGYNRWGYDPWSPYGSYYRQYVFKDPEEAVTKGYKQGFKTGKDDGKKEKSYKPERSRYFHDSGFGNYAEAYRSGFSDGYAEGYQLGSNERAAG